MAGLCPPLPTLRRRPYGRQRTARGRCGSLLLHRSGLAPPTPCRSPGAREAKPISVIAVIDGYRCASPILRTGAASRHVKSVHSPFTDHPEIDPFDQIRTERLGGAD